MGPVRGYVSDETGNVMGNYPGEPKDIAYQSIPGGQYNAFPDSDYKSFFLNDAGSYTGELEVVGRGSVQLEARTYAQSKAKRAAVFRVRVPAGARLRIEFATGQNPSSLRLSIDRDGDGNTDRVVAPDSTAMGPASREKDPPNTVATSEAVTEGRSSVALSTEDGPQGSGVADTYYMLQGDTRSRLYTEPLNVPSGTVLRFLSVDNAGNMERVKKAVANGAP